jgi:hypothetical protein
VVNTELMSFRSEMTPDGGGGYRPAHGESCTINPECSLLILLEGESVTGGDLAT